MEDLSGLMPEEKLYYAVRGWPTVYPDHFMSDLGKKAINEALNEVIKKGEKTHSLSESARRRGVRVLRLRFGFEPRTEKEKVRRHRSDARTLDEVKVYFGVTRERVRQIEGRMLRILRHRVYRQYFLVDD